VVLLGSLRIVHCNRGSNFPKNGHKLFGLEQISPLCLYILLNGDESRYPHLINRVQVTEETP